MKIKDLPVEIQQLVKIRWENHDNTIKDSFDINEELTAGFSFDNSPERGGFWWKIDAGSYEDFYKLYHHTKKQTKVSPYIKSGNKIIYYATIKGKKATVTIEYEE